MYTILTLFKKDTDIIKELFLGPTEPVLACFSTNSSIDGKYGSAFLASMQGIVNNSGDYVEIHMEFIDNEKYQEWHDIFGATHDPARAELDRYLRDRGITVTRYFESTDLADPAGTKPISEFVPRNEFLTPFSNPVNF